MEHLRNEEKEYSIYPLVLSFGAKRTSDAQAKSKSTVKERASRIEKAYKFALHDKVDFEGAMEWLNTTTRISKTGKNLKAQERLF